MISPSFRAAALCAAVIGVVWPASAQADEQRKAMMDRSQPIECFKDAEAQVWRVQCDAKTKICLYAANEELDSFGHRAKPLERAKRCPMFNMRPFDRTGLEAQGYTFVEGVPDAPYGWTRDNRGRVFQINFDLKRRMYVGGSYAPGSLVDGSSGKSRFSVDFGLLVFEHFGGPRHPNRHRVRLVEGEVFMDPFSAELTLAHYDLSRRFLDPLLRITTFFGQPQRHDLVLNLGVWAEAGSLEVHHTPAANSNLWKFATLQATLDIWQSRRIESFARIRSGVGVEKLYVNGPENRVALTPGHAFEIDWVMDKKGFHNLRAEVLYETPFYNDPAVVAGKRATRMHAKLRYEAILVAINDQPLSLRLDAGSEKRSDVPGVPFDWAFVANAGLRFSLWAPPRSPG